MNFKSLFKDVQPLAGGPLETKPTLFCFGLFLSCERMMLAPGKSAVSRRRFAKKYENLQYVKKRNEFSI